MPKANLTQIEAQKLRIQRRLEQKENERKIRELEKQQQLAIEKKEQEEEKVTKLKKPENYDSKNFIIREWETDEEKRQRLDAKKQKEQKFMEQFEPDFDLDEVPPLEEVKLK